MADKKRPIEIQFNTTEWLAMTARMPRIVRSVLHDLCCYTWERGCAVPPSEVFLMTSDLPDGQGEAIIENLIAGGHLIRDDGFVWSPRALEQAEEAFALREAKSRGGRKRETEEQDAEQRHRTMMAAVAMAHAAGKPASAEEPEQPQEAARPAALPPRPVGLTEEQTADLLAGRQVRPNVAMIGLHEITEAWNKMAAKNGFKQIKVMTEERIKRLNARIAEHGGEPILHAIRSISSMDPSKPTFDSILKPDTCEAMIAACGQPDDNSGDGEAG